MPEAPSSDTNKTETGRKPLHCSRKKTTRKKTGQKLLEKRKKVTKKEGNKPMVHAGVYIYTLPQCMKSGVSIHIVYLYPRDILYI